MKPSDRFRNSQLVQLRHCAFSYAETYVYGKEGQPSPSLRGGSNVHDAVALAVRELVKDGPFLDVHAIAYRAVRGGQVEYSDAVEIVSRFAEAVSDGEIRINAKAVFLLESMLEMQVQLFTGETVTFFGTPDLAERVNRTVCKITDWKTHHHPESESEFKIDPQLKRYALLISEQYPAFERFKLEKRFVRFKNKKYEMELTREDLYQVKLELASEIQVAREAEQLGEFPATGGVWCGLCQHHPTCPLIARYRDAGADLLSIESDARASELAGAAVALDAASARLKGHLKRYLGADHKTGYVAVAGGTYGYGKTTCREVGPEPLEAIFVAHSLEMDPDLLKVDLKTLDRMKKRLPDDMVREIDGITEITESSQCRYRSSGATKATTPVPAEESAEMERF